MTTPSVPFMLSRCTGCGHHSSLAIAACSQCGGQSFEVVPASGRGVVRARSEVWRAPDAFWRQYVPYALVLVRLDEGPVLMGHAAREVAIGDAVHASNAMLGDHRVIRFEPVASDSFVRGAIA